MNARMKRLALWILIGPAFAFGFQACGSSGGPFPMNTQAIIFVGDPNPAIVNNIEFIINPEQQSGSGQLTAEIESEDINSFDLSIQSFNITLNYASIGPVTLVLDPSLPSTATIFKLNLNGKPEGTHQMTLNLIAQTADQNLALSNLLLTGDTNNLTLSGTVPELGFTFQGQPKVLDLTNLQVQVPGSLNISNQDPGT